MGRGSEAKIQLRTKFVYLYNFNKIYTNLAHFTATWKLLPHVNLHRKSDRAYVEYHRACKVNEVQLKEINTYIGVIKKTKNAK